MKPRLKLSKSRHGGASRQQVPTEICLLAYDEILIHLGSDRHCGLAEADDLRHVLHPERLAEAARRLLPPESGLYRQVGLYLPAHEFVVTQINLPGVDPDNVYNAARLQLPMLLPGINEPMLLVVHGGETGGPDYPCLWLPASRAEALFSAFRQQDLFLGRILPRPLAALSSEIEETERIYDLDAHTVTYVEWSRGRLQRWLYLPREEYAEAEFRTQFEQQIGEAESAQGRRLESVSDWLNRPLPSDEVSHYAFVPPSAHFQIQQARRQRRRRWLTLAIIGVVLLLALGLGGVLYYEHRLEQRLEQLRQRTQDVTHLRAEILEIEEHIGPVRKFPRQNVVEILLTLNRLIPRDSWISSLKVEAGVVEFEGQSPNPTQILETLTAQPEFAAVAFSRPIQGQRFGISFRLAGMDVPAYLQEYLPMLKP